MKALFRCVFGTLEVSVNGAVERFLNAAFEDGVHIWRVRRTDGRALSFCIYRRSLPALERALRVSGCEIRIDARRGLPHSLRGYRSRFGLLAGALLIAAGLYASSFFIWRIEVSGCKDVSPAEVTDLLAKNGFSVGCRRDRRDVSLIENACLLDSDKMSWMSINIIGTTAYVEIRERSDPPPIVDTSEPCSIYASRDGVIASIEAYMGYPVLSPGDTVTAGDLIVTGDYTDKYGVRSIHHSYAKVMAYTVHSRSVTVPLKRTEHVPTGRVKNKYSIKIIRFSIPLYFSKKIMYNNYDRNVSEHVLRLSDSFALPVSLVKTSYTEVEHRELTLSKEAALYDAREKLRDFEYDLVGITVLGRSEKESVSGGSVTATVTLDCYEDIGFTRKIT